MKIKTLEILGFATVLMGLRLPLANELITIR
jgi:hypothetical protein